MKSYIIVGDNNFWYGAFDADNQSDIDLEVARIERGINEGDYEADSKPSELFVYEAAKYQTVEL